MTNTNRSLMLLTVVLMVSSGALAGAPEPVTDAPTPEPVTDAPTPEPVTDAPTPEPVAPTTPQPVTDAPTPEPVAPTTPQPVTDAPTPEPVAPITPEPVAEPATDAPTPEPVAEPATDAPTPEPEVIVTPSPVPVPLPLPEVNTCAVCTLFGDANAICRDGTCVCNEGFQQPACVPNTGAEPMVSVAVGMLFNRTVCSNFEENRNTVIQTLRSFFTEFYQNEPAILTADCQQTQTQVSTLIARTPLSAATSIVSEAFNNRVASDPTFREAVSPLGQLQAATTNVQPLCVVANALNSTFASNGECIPTECAEGFELEENACIKESGSGLSGTEIAAIVLGCVFALLIVGGLVVVLTRQSVASGLKQDDVNEPTNEN